MKRLFTVFAVFFLFSTATHAQTPAPATASSPNFVATGEGAPQSPAKPFVYVAKPSDVTMGKKNAPVTIVEYASFSCPHCAHFYNEDMPKLTTKYIDTGKVFFVYRDYPLNAPALRASELVQCADADRRHAFVKVLFSTQSKWAFDLRYEDALAGIAALGAIDRTKFNACLKDKNIENTILEIVKEASDNYHIDSTPSFFINGQMHKGENGFESMSAIIDNALATRSAK